MTKEEFFARVDEAKKGSSKSFVNVDELDKYIRALWLNGWTRSDC